MGAVAAGDSALGVLGEPSGSNTSYRRLTAALTVLRCPDGQSIVTVNVSFEPAAKVYSGSEPERYMPPDVTSLTCSPTGPPRTRILAPIPCVLGELPRNRMARRAAVASLRYSAADASCRFITMSRSPSPSKSAAAMPCAMSGSVPKFQASVASSNVKFPRLRKAAFGSARVGNSSISRCQFGFGPRRMAWARWVSPSRASY